MAMMVSRADRAWVDRVRMGDPNHIHHAHVIHMTEEPRGIIGRVAQGIAQLGRRRVTY
jgi:hypothetical protein